MFGFEGSCLLACFLKENSSPTYFCHPCSHNRQPISLNRAISTHSCWVKGSGQKTSRLDENVCFYFILTEHTGVCIKTKHFFCDIRNKVTISGTNLVPMGKVWFPSIAISMDHNQLYQPLKVERKQPASARGTPVSSAFRRHVYIL